MKLSELLLMRYHEQAGEFADEAAELEARAEKAEARLMWIEETQRTHYDAEARAAAAERESERLDAALEKAEVKLAAVREYAIAAAPYSDAATGVLAILDGTDKRPSE